MTTAKGLLQEYLYYCEYKREAESTGQVDLSSLRFIFPTFLLALKSFQVESRKVLRIIPPTLLGVKHYSELMMTSQRLNGSISYIPIIELPKNYEQSSKVVNTLMRIHQNGKRYGGENAFKYLLWELIANIYEHSNFKNAYVMAQRYEKKGFVEVCLLDNGIGIQASYKKIGISISDIAAINNAIQGLSSKSLSERGYGISSNLRIFTMGLKGEVLIVSGIAAASIIEGNATFFKLKEQQGFKGTLVSIRIPYPAKEVNIYEFIDH